MDLWRVSRPSSSKIIINFLAPNMNFTLMEKEGKATKPLQIFLILYRLKLQEWLQGKKRAKNKWKYRIENLQLNSGRTFFHIFHQQVSWLRSFLVSITFMHKLNIGLMVKITKNSVAPHLPKILHALCQWDRSTVSQTIYNILMWILQV